MYEKTSPISLLVYLKSLGFPLPLSIAVYVKKHYVYVQSGVTLSLLHYSCDSMRLLCVVWSVGKRSSCFVVSKREKLSLVWQVFLLRGGDRWGE